MVRRLLIVAIATIPALIGPALMPSPSEAGVYQVQVCASGDRSGNQNALTWATSGAGATDIWGRPFGTGCISGIGLLQNWSGADAPQGAVAVYGMNAPSGTSFTSAAWQQLIQITGGGSRCVYGSDSAGNILGSSQTCLSNAFSQIDSGWVQQSWSGSSDSFQLRTACVFGPCNGGGANQITSQFSSIGVNITDGTNPSLSSGSGIWSESDWVRGSWSLGWTGSDSMGIKAHRYFVDSVSQNDTLVCDPAFFSGGGYYFGSGLVPCPSTTSSNASYTVNTANYTDNSHTLQLSSYDATSDGSSNQGTASTTIKTDNSAPGTPSISGPGNTNNTTPTFTFSASDPESGISGYECSLNSGAYFACSSPYTAPTQSPGDKSFSVRAKNNAKDSSGVVATGDVESLVYVLNITPPTATFSAEPSNPTNANPLVYTLDFDKTISGLSAADFTIEGTASGCSVSTSASAGTSFTISLSSCLEGTAGITLKANSVTDAFGNAGPSADLVSAPVTVERTKPTAYWTEPASPTNEATLEYTLVFSEAVTGVAGADFQNNGSASGCLFTPSNTAGVSITIYVSGCSSGTVIAQLNANTVTDAIGNVGPSSPRVASTVIIDRIGPVGSWTEPASPTKATTLNYILTTNENASGMSDSDLQVSGTATGCSASVTGASGTSFPVTVTGCSAGTVILTLKANTLTDDLGNVGPATENTSQPVTIDRTPATAVWTEPASPTNALNLSYALTFNENVSGLTGADFAFSGTATGCSASPDNPSGTAFTIIISGCSAGTVIVGLKAGAVTDDAGNLSPASQSNASSVTIDRTPATAAWTEPVSPTNSANLTYTLTFSESVSGLTGADFTFAGTATGCSASPSAASGTSFTITVSGCSEGAVVAKLKAESVQDVAGNLSPSNVESASSVTINRTPATAVWTEPASPTKATSMAYTITFSENISGLAGSDFVFSGTATGCSASPNVSSGTFFTVTVSGCSAGTVIVGLEAGAVTDDAGNLSPASQSNASSVTIDRTPATAVWTEPASPTNSASLAYILTFNENISGLTSSDFFVTGTATGCSASPSAASGTILTITVSGCSAGTVIITLQANAVTDDAGNLSPASQSNASSVTIDRTPATAAWTEPSSPTNDLTLTYILAFSESVSGLTGGDFSFTGTASGCSASPDSASGATFTITVSGCSGGTVVLTLEKDSAQDAAGNLTPTSDVAASAVTIDRTPATASWTEPSSPTDAGSLVYTLNFDENVSGLNAGAFTVTGTATGCLVNVSGTSGASFTVTLSSCSEGTVILTLLRDSVTDDSGNLSPASNKAATSVTVDRTPATAAWTEPASPTNAGSLVYTLDFDENISGLTNDDFSFSGTATGCVASTDASSGTTFTITISGCSQGTVVTSLKADSVTDNAGNSSPASEESASEVTIDRTPATAAWTEPASPTNAASLIYTLIFTKNVSGLTIYDFSFAGTATGCVATPDTSTGTNFTITVSGCSQGTFFISLNQDSVSDDAGNLAPTNYLDASEVIIDRSPPTLTWTEPASPTNKADLTYAINFDENVTGLDEGDFSNQGTASGCVFAVSGSGASYTITVSGCSQGTVIVRLGADSVVDAAGNGGPASDSNASAVTVDRTPATAAWTAPSSPQMTLPIDYTLDFDKSISDLTGDDFENAGSAESCVFTPSASSGTSFTISISGCTAGTVIPRLKKESVEDDAGNKSPANDSDGSAVEYQTKPEGKISPTIIGSPSAGQILTADEGQWYGTAPIAFFYQWLRCLATDPDNCSNVGTDSKTYPLGADDAGFLIRVEVTASNDLGFDKARTGPTDAITLPAPQITKSPANPASSGTIEWDSIAGTESLCSVNGGPYEICTSPFSIDGYPEGSFTFSVKQKKGSEVSPVSSVSFRIDRSPPEAPTISEYPANPTNKTSALFRFFGENEASFQCKWDGDDWAVCASPDNKTGMALGDHTFLVRQIDTAGNISQAASYSWKIVAYDPDVIGDKIEMGSNKYDPVSGGSTKKALMTCGVNRGTFATCEVFTFAMIKKVTHKNTKQCNKKVNQKKKSCQKIVYKYASFGKGKVINKNNLGGVEIKVTLNRSGKSLLSKSRGPLKVRTNYRVVLPNGKTLRDYKISYIMPPTQRVTVLYGSRLYQQQGKLTPYGRSYIKKVTATMPRTMASVTCYGYSSSRLRAYSYRIARDRAQSICSDMRSLGIKARYKIVSYGNSKPRRSNKSKTGRMLNNRTVISVRYK